MNIISLTQPTNGKAVKDQQQGSILYTPVLGFVGADTFTYTVWDEPGNSDTATVTVTVTPSVSVSTRAPAVAVAYYGVRAGSEIPVSADGFAASESVDVYLLSADGAVTSLDSVNTDSGGHLSLDAVIPADLAEGEYTLVLSGLSGNIATSSVTASRTDR